VAALGRTDLDVFRVCLGGNVFGWTADEAQSHAVLDAYADAGGNFVDTANEAHASLERLSGAGQATRT
jgi:aryl-alcohol dehydrogenase-like predicted oxidoreductase